MSFISMTGMSSEAFGHMNNTNLDSVFALLHNRHPIRSSDASNESQLYKEQDRLEHSTHDKMSIVGVLEHPTVERSRCLEVDYFSLYMPLLS